jgi:hypothetical protein
MAKPVSTSKKAVKSSVKTVDAIKKPARNFRRNVIITGIIAGLFIVLANSAIWTNRYLFDSNNFTNTAVSSLTSDPSRNALATEITDQALKDYPKIKSVVDDTAINFISGLLGSNRVEQILTKTVSRLQIFLTSPKRQPVVINLENTKEVISRLIQVSGREEEALIDPAKIPDQITVFNPDNFPNFYNAGVTLTWLSPLLGIGAIALLVWPYVSHRKHYQELLIIQGSCVAVFGALALLLGPLVRPVALGNIQSANIRIVVGNLYDAFIATFNSQTMFVIGFGLLAIITSGVIIGIQRYKSSKK